MPALGWIFFTGTIVVLALGLYIYLRDKMADRQHKHRYAGIAYCRAQLFSHYFQPSFPVLPLSIRAGI